MTHMIVPTIVRPARPLITPTAFANWRAQVSEDGASPVIGVAGSRGKTTVVRLLAAILAEAGLQTAIKTNVSVDIRGKRQRGEIEPWSRSLSELEHGTLDVAIEEIDWRTVHTMRLQPDRYPLMVVTNICGNREACQIHGEARIAAAALPSVIAATHRLGTVVINGDDLDVAREESGAERVAVFVGLNRDSPGLRSHLASGGTAAWVEDNVLMFGESHGAREIGVAQEIPFALFGQAGFQIQNALTAISVAMAMGIDPSAIERALLSFSTLGSAMPGAFQIIEFDGVTAVVDRPNPSWFLRSVLRSLRGFGANRIITVAGPMPSVPEDDLREVGRLLGRVSSLFVLHSTPDEHERFARLKSGAAMNQVPPIVVHTKSEGRALTRALSTSKPGELVLVLSDRPAQISRTLRRSALVRSTGDDSSAARA